MDLRLWNKMLDNNTKAFTPLSLFQKYKIEKLYLEKFLFPPHQKSIPPTK